MRMAAAVETQLPGDRISKRNFDKLARFIYDYSGIKMPPTKLTMLEGRLRRRLRATNHGDRPIGKIRSSGRRADGKGRKHTETERKARTSRHIGKRHSYLLPRISAAISPPRGMKRLGQDARKTTAERRGGFRL